MPEQTTNLKLPIPLGNENVNRQFFLDLIQAVDTGAVSERQLTEAIGQVAIALTQDYASTDQATAISADAVRRGLETKQNTVRLADNYLAASALINAAPDAQNRAYPDGFSFFKVSSAAGGWPTSNGYVMTMRAGSGGVQLYFEMYMGNVQSEKTARIWTRSKRDANGFWQDWNRVATENDLAFKMDVNRGSNLVPNGSGEFGLLGWTVRGGINGWGGGKGSGEAVGEFAFTFSTDANTAYIDSDKYTIGIGVYNISAEFWAAGAATSDHYIEVLSYNSAGTGTIIGSIAANAADRWTRRGGDITFPAGAVSFAIRMAVLPNKTATYKGFRRIQLTGGSGMKAWNNDSAHILSYQMSFLANRALELGLNVPGSAPAFIDFHTGVVGRDWNARILADADNTANGADVSLNYIAKEHRFTGPLYVDGTDLKKSVSDGKAAVRAAITGKSGTVVDADGDGVPTHAELAAGVGKIPDAKIFASNYTRNADIYFGSRYPIVTIPPIKRGVAILPYEGWLNLGSMVYSRLALTQGSNVIQFQPRSSFEAIFIEVSTKRATARSSNSGDSTVILDMFNFDLPFNIEFVGYDNQATSLNQLIGRGLYG